MAGLESFPLACLQLLKKVFADKLPAWDELAGEDNEVRQ